ncbi:hypothetical protein SprV_0401726900 [Sparganum proliferum]
MPQDPRRLEIDGHLLCSWRLRTSKCLSTTTVHDLLFADDCAPSTATEADTPWGASGCANFGPTISTAKTVHQPPPNIAYSIRLAPTASATTTTVTADDQNPHVPPPSATAISIIPATTSAAAAAAATAARRRVASGTTFIAEASSEREILATTTFRPGRE